VPNRKKQTVNYLQVLNYSQKIHIMKIILAILALFVCACFAGSNCPASISTTFFKSQTFLAVNNNNFVNKNIVVRDFANGKGYINILGKLIGVYGYDVKGVKGPNNVDLSVDAVAFVMNVLTEASLQWYFAEAAVDVSLNNGNVSFVGASAAFLGFASRAFGIVEYEDTNGQAGFQLTDNILGGYDLANTFLGQWCDIEAKVVPYTDVNGVTFNVRSASAITQDNVFGFRVTSVGRYAQIDGINVDPNTIKIDFVINYFNNNLFASANWVKGYNGQVTVPSDAAAHPNSSIALVTGFAAVAAAGAVGAVKTITTDPNGNAQTGIAYGVAAGASGAAAALYSYFTFKQNAVVQVAGISDIQAGVFVAKTSAADPTGNSYWNIQTALSGGAYAKWGTVDLAIFSFDCHRPTQVYWDPSIAGTSPVSSTNFAGTYSSAFFLMAIFAVLFALF